MVFSPKMERGFVTAGNISLDNCRNVLHMFRMIGPAPNFTEEDDAAAAPAWARLSMT